MDNNYMKTILSGVKEWTENLTDDAIDKANNALEQANNALDKALFVVNITTTDGVTYSADKTFDEIVQAYNEGKYNIVAHAASVNNLIFPLLGIGNYSALFGGTTADGIIGFFGFIITDNNEIQIVTAPLATTDSKLPNPHPITFTGAVSETYDGSSAKTIEIPSGGGGGASGLGIFDNYDVTLISFVLIDQDTLPIDAGIEITTDDNGNPFSYDGIVVWSDIKSGVSYTDIKFNGIQNFYFPFPHGVKTSMSVYITDGQSMRAIRDGGSNVYIKQTRADVNEAFFPAEFIADIPEKLTSIHLCPRYKVASGTFYKIWGLTKK